VEKLTTLGSIKILRFSPWESVSGICQGVTVRSGASEKSEFFTLLASELKALGLSAAVRLKQVHSSEVVPLSGQIPPGGPRQQADGLLGSGDCRAAGAVTVADCVPVFLLDRATCGWALLHAGWRGIAAGILPRAVRKLTEHLSTYPDKLEMYLGPAACGSCYGVGPEVAARFETCADGTDSGAVSTVGDKTCLDLRGFLASQARNCGVPPAGIHPSRYCTHCHNHLFYSYRVEGPHALRRMWAFLGSPAS